MSEYINKVIPEKHQASFALGLEAALRVIIAYRSMALSMRSPGP